MADGAGLENRYGETHRGFESHALRLITSSAGDRPVITTFQTLKATADGRPPAQVSESWRLVVRG